MACDPGVFEVIGEDLLLVEVRREVEVTGPDQRGIARDAKKIADLLLAHDPVPALALEVGVGHERPIPELDEQQHPPLVRRESVDARGRVASELV